MGQAILSLYSLSGFSGKLLAWNPRSWPSHAALLFRRVFVSFQAGGGMTAGDLKSDHWLLGVLRTADMPVIYVLWSIPDLGFVLR